MKTNCQTKKLGEVWWEEKKLGEVLQKTETINPTQNPEKEFIYIDVSSVNNKHFIIENTTLLKGINAPSRARKLVKKGDVIFATVRPTLRRIAIIPKEYDGQVCSTGYFVLRAKEHINNKLLFYFLLTNRFNEEMEKLQKGASYPAVTDNEVREQIIHYPKTLPEQQRIVAILDEAFAAIATAKENAEKNLQNSRELFESYLQSVFANPGDGWEEKPLGKVCSDFLQGINTATDKTVFVNSGIPIFQAKEIGINKLELGNCKFITQDKYEASAKRYKPQIGDILYNNIGSSMGRSIEVVWDYPFTIAWNVMRIIPNRNKTIPKFLNYLLQSPIIFKSILNKSKGVGMPFISKKDLIEIVVCYPSLSEQKPIISKLDALSAETQKIEAIYRQKLADLDELKKSVLEKAFSGNL